MQNVAATKSAIDSQTWTAFAPHKSDMFLNEILMKQNTSITVFIKRPTQ